MKAGRPPPLKPMLTVQVLASQDLTKQELAVLTLLCQGMTRKEIAQSRHRSLGTVGKQIEILAYKLDAHSHAEIVAMAVARGIVHIGLRAVAWIVAGLIALAVLESQPPKPVEAVWQKVELTRQR